jgi:hypothetical protein
VSQITKGSVVKCQRGKLGVVTKLHKSATSGLITYIGVAFDGSNWESINPIFVASNLNKYCDKERQRLRSETYEKNCKVCM